MTTQQTLDHRPRTDLRLTIAEASAVCDALDGGVLVMAGDDILGWGADVAALIVRLRTLTPLGQYALVDAIERFWREPHRDAGETLRETGLTTQEE